MNEQEIIKALMDNTSAFGLMDVPLINKAESIGKGQFEIWGENQDDSYSWLSFIAKTCTSDFDPQFTYRLSPDYTPAEQEVVKCEVRKEEVYKNGKWLRYGSGGHQIDFAPADPDFIGIEAGGFIFGMFRAKFGGHECFTVIKAGMLDKYEVLDMTKAKVLFRGKK